MRTKRWTFKGVQRDVQPLYELIQWPLSANQVAASERWHLKVQRTYNGITQHIHRTEKDFYVYSQTLFLYRWGHSTQQWVCEFERVCRCVGVPQRTEYLIEFCVAPCYSSLDWEPLTILNLPAMWEGQLYLLTLCTVCACMCLEVGPMRWLWLLCCFSRATQVPMW